MSDGYSDIDVQIHCSDLGAGVADRHRVLEPLGPIELEWQMPSPSEIFTSTIFFRNESYYHKLDLGFSGPGTLSPATSPGSPFFFPAEPGSPAHFLIGQLLGVLRYVKARKRGQMLTCWRFAAALVDRLAVVLHPAMEVKLDIGQKLNTWEYMKLDRRLDSAESSTILSHIDFSSPAVMDRNVIWLTWKLIVRTNQIAAVHKKTIPSEPIENLMRFITSELTE
jgi:hypothetical protein